MRVRVVNAAVLAVGEQPGAVELVPAFHEARDVRRDVRWVGLHLGDWVTEVQVAREVVVFLPGGRFVLIAQTQVQRDPPRQLEVVLDVRGPLLGVDVERVVDACIPVADATQKQRSVRVAALGDIRLEECIRRIGRIERERAGTRSCVLLIVITQGLPELQVMLAMVVAEIDLVVVLALVHHPPAPDTRAGIPHATEIEVRVVDVVAQNTQHRLVPVAIGPELGPFCRPHLGPIRIVIVFDVNGSVTQVQYGVGSGLINDVCARVHGVHDSPVVGTWKT